MIRRAPRSTCGLHHGHRHEVRIQVSGHLIRHPRDARQVVVASKPKTGQWIGPPRPLTVNCWIRRVKDLDHLMRVGSGLLPASPSSLPITNLAGPQVAPTHSSLCPPCSTITSEPNVVVIAGRRTLPQAGYRRGSPGRSGRSHSGTGGGPNGPYDPGPAQPARMWRLRPP